MISVLRPGPAEAAPLSSRWRGSRGRTATSCRSPGGSCATACATAARSARPACRDWTLPGHAPVHGAARVDAAEHGAGARSRPLLDDVSVAAGVARRGAARARAAARADAAATRRARVSAGRRWDEALDRLAAELRATSIRSASAFYLTSRGITNEVYYAAQKAARFLGTNHVDNSARLCHAASTVGDEGDARLRRVDVQLRRLARRRSHRASSARTSPTTSRSRSKYLYHAKQNGAQIAVVNPYREPGSRALLGAVDCRRARSFGTRIADHWFDVHTGGDLAFLDRRAARAGRDSAASTTRSCAHRPIGFDEARATRARDRRGRRLERESGATRERRSSAFARLLRRRPNAVFVWSMGLTQHAHGVDTVKALVNVGLARGLPGRAESRPHADPRPLGRAGRRRGRLRARRRRGDRAHAGRDVWGFRRPRSRGLDGRRDGRPRRAAGEVDCFWMVGGNFLETLAGRRRGRGARSQRPRLRIHQDIVLSIVDARRGRRRRAAPAGGDALRVAGRRHRDHDRAAHHLLARDPGPPHRIGAAGVVGVSRGHGARRSRARASRRLRGRRGDPRRRSPARCRCTPASRRCRGQGRPGAVGRPACSTRTAASRRPTARRASRRCAPAASRALAGRSASSSRRAAASSSTRWCSARSIR